MGFKTAAYLIVSVQITVLLVGCVEGLSDTPEAPIPSSTNNSGTTTTFPIVTKETLKYCGSQLLPPWKKFVCQKYCEEATCQNFFCECNGAPTVEKNCTHASETGKCARYCKKANFAEAFHCPDQSGKSYCICS